MFSWFTNLSTYYIRLERLAIISAAILLLAFLSFGMIASFELKAVFFVVLSVAIFGMEPIMNRLFCRTKLTEADKAIVKKIRTSGLPVDEQRAFGTLTYGFLKIVQHNHFLSHLDGCRCFLSNFFNCLTTER